VSFRRYAAASPIITVFATGYFLFVWAFWRFAVLYYFERCYESGGRMFEVIFSQASRRYSCCVAVLSAQFSGRSSPQQIGLNSGVQRRRGITMLVCLVTCC